MGTGGAAGGAGGTPADASRDASGGAGGINIVQTSPTETSTEDVPTLTLAEAPAAGNAIIVGVTCHSTFNIDCVISPSGVSDNQGNSYARIVQGEAILSSQQGARGYIFIAENISAPNGEVVISVDPDGTSTLQAVSWGAVEVSGLAAAPSLYTSGSSLVSGNGATATTATTDLATTQANELAVGVASGRSDDTNMLITPETTWTQHQRPPKRGEWHPWPFDGHPTADEYGNRHPHLDTRSAYAWGNRHHRDIPRRNAELMLTTREHDRHRPAQCQPVPRNTAFLT